MAIDRKSLSKIKKVTDAIHQSRLAEMRRHRQDLASLAGQRDAIKAEAIAASDLNNPENQNLAMVAQWTSWADRRVQALHAAETSLEAKTDALVLNAIKSLGQTRAVQSIEKDLDKTARQHAERIEERSATATMKPATLGPMAFRV